MQSHQFRPFCLLLGILPLVGFLTTGCTLDASILGSQESVLKPKFSMSVGNVDLQSFSLTRSQITTGSDGFPYVTIQWAENASANEIRFSNIPAEADLICDSFIGNPAVAAADLETDRVIYLNESFWQVDQIGWDAIQIQEFECYYQLGEDFSNPISFRIELNEAEVIKVTDPQQNPLDKVKSPIIDADISGDGQYLAFVTNADILSLGSEVSQVYRMNLATQEIELISKSPTGIPGNFASSYPSISHNGSRVAFSSNATNLASQDTNADSDVFLKDFTTGTLKLISRATDQASANGTSGEVDISSNGEFVAYSSSATNIVAGDVNGQGDIFVYKVSDETTVIASLSSTQVQADDWCSRPSISGDGRYVAFDTWATTLHPDDFSGFSDDVFVRDLQTNTTAIASIAQDGDVIDFGTREASISDDGRYVSFMSFSSWVFAGDTNSSFDIFVRDMVGNTTEHISKSTAGVQANDSSTGAIISKDGNSVFYMSRATNLEAGDTNGFNDVIKRNLVADTTSILSKSSLGVLGNGTSYPISVSSDGRYVVFYSAASNLVSDDDNNGTDLFLLDQVDSSVVRLAIETSRANSNGSVTGGFVISETGQYVAYSSDATNLVANDTNSFTDVFMYNRATGGQELISKSSAGIQGNNLSANPRISDEGRFVVYRSLASNLVAGDGNAKNDIFYHDRTTGETLLISESLTGTTGNDESLVADISSDGSFVVFDSKATDLVLGDTNGRSDIFLWTKVSGAVEKISINGSNQNPNGDSSNPKISANGRYIAYQSAATDLVIGDTNGRIDVFVYDLDLNTTQKVSVSTDGVQANADCVVSDISWDGRYVLFTSTANNLDMDTNTAKDLFIRDTQLGTTELITKNSNGIQDPSLVVDGSISMTKDNRYVSFAHPGSSLDQSELVHTWSHVFVRDLQLGTTVRVSRRADGKPFSMGASSAHMSLDGRYIVMISNASDNVAEDFNSKADLFVRKINLD